MSSVCFVCGDKLCGGCEGSGRYTTYTKDGRTYVNIYRECPVCDGKGWIDAEHIPMTCPHCESTSIAFHREDGGGYYCSACGKAEENGNMMSHPVLSTDPSVVCQECRKEKS